MTDTGSLLESFALSCARCGGGDPDMFTDPEGLEAFLAEPAAGIRSLTAAHFAGFGPVHKRCVTPPRRRPAFGYDILESVK